MSRRLARLVLDYDGSHFSAPGTDEVRGPKLASGEEVNDEWSGWLTECVGSSKIQLLAIEAPAAHWYWALLGGTAGEDGDDGQVARARGRVGSEADLFALETFLPVPVDETEARFAPAGAGVIVACAAEREVLSHWIASAESSGAQVTSLRPTGLPGSVNEHLNGRGERILKHLEFRSGAFEHPRLKRRRKVNLRLLAAGWILACGIVAWGWMREAAELAELTQAARDAIPELARSVLGPDFASAPDPVRALSNLVERQTKLTGSNVNQYQAKPVVDEFMAVLANWPDVQELQIDSITLDNRRLLIEGTAPNLATGEVFAQMLGGALPESEWAGFFPRSNQQRGSDRYEFQVSGTRQRSATPGGR